MNLITTAAITMVASVGAFQQPHARSIVRLENTLVRVVEITYAPNAVAPVHTHEYPRAVYVIESGVMELISERGDTSQVELTAGQTLWRPAETHVVRNVGRTPVRVLETEVKTATKQQPPSDR